MQAGERDRPRAAGQADTIGHLGHGADPRIIAAVTRDEHYALLIAHVDGQGEVHVGEDDGVFQRDEKEVHVSSSSICAYDT
jgi:hypothetical protein